MADDKKQESTLDRIRAQHDVGSRLELTLFEGAEYYDGSTPAPTVNMQGYDPTDKMTKNPGMKVTGYVVRYDTHPESGRVVMTPTSGEKPWPNLGTWYVDEKCIHSFNG